MQTDQTFPLQYNPESLGNNSFRDLKEILNYSPEAITLVKFISVLKFAEVMCWIEFTSKAPASTTSVSSCSPSK